MDTDGDNEITEFEYIKFMLVTADLCNDSVLDALHARFCAMDTDGVRTNQKINTVMTPNDETSIIDERITKLAKTTVSLTLRTN